MKDLFELLKTVYNLIHKQKTWEEPPYGGKLFIIDMDNVPNNGDVIKKHMMTILAEHQHEEGAEEIKDFFENKMCFFNTMVDRITSQRVDNPMIPRCEPVPAKALVISDDNGDLPMDIFSKLKNDYGIVVRVKNPMQIQTDIDLKLRIANATHTAVVQAMALMKLTNTEALSPTSGSDEKNSIAKLLMSYLDSFVENQIYISNFPGLSLDNENDKKEIQYVYDDWRKRLTHAYFGLNTFFPTLNGAAKGGIRFGPTINDLLQSQTKPITVVTAYAYAALIRWLTPIKPTNKATTNSSFDGNSIYIGWLQEADRASAISSIDENDGTVVYADGLRHNLEKGWYEFRCNCQVKCNEGSNIRPLSDILSEVAAANTATESYSSESFLPVIRSYLLAPDGGNLSAGAESNNTLFTALVQAIATLYARMISGDNLLDLLKEMHDSSGPYINGMESECTVLMANN